MASPEFFSIHNHYAIDSGNSQTESISQRDHIVTAFRNAVQLMRYEDRESSSLRTLTHEEELDMMLIEDSANRIRFYNGDNTITRQWLDKKTGEHYTIDEGVPVEGLLSWLKRQMHSHSNKSSQQNLHLYLQAKELYETLLDYSLPFQDCHDEMPAKTYREMRVARIRLEEDLIESCLPGLDPRRRRELAHKRINNRLELRPPIDFDSPDRTREAAKSLFLTNDEQSAKTDKKQTRVRKLISHVPTESVVFVGAATAANTVLRDQGMDPETVLAATTATVSGITAATQLKRFKNNGNVDLSKKKQVARYSLATGGATLAAGTTTPDVILHALDAVPPQIEGAIKATVPTIIGIGGYAARRQLKAYYEKLTENSGNKTELNTRLSTQEYEITKLSQLAVYESISVLMDHYAKMSNKAKRLGNKITKQWNIQGSEFEDTTKDLMMISITQKGSEAQRAFVRYRALSNFERFRELYIDKDEKKPNGVQKKTPALDALRDIDHLALSAFDNLDEFFCSDTEELRRFSHNYERGLGLAYLFFLRQSWDSDDPRTMLFDEKLHEIETSVFGDKRPELEGKVNLSYKQMLRVARFKPIRKVVRKIKQKRYSDAADDIVDIIKDTTKIIIRI